MKVCNKCGETKKLTAFFKDKNNKADGHYSICKVCKQATTYLWRDKNKDRYNSSMRNWQYKNKDSRRDVDLKRKYGSSLKEYNSIFEEQGFVCWICRKINSSKKRLFAMDHNHETGKVRGILCYGCNRALHILEKNDLLERAILYLKNHG